MTKLYLMTDLCCFRLLIKDQPGRVSLHPDKTEDDPPDLNARLTPSQTIVRRTKTQTQSRILGNGDLLEQTVVKEVTETVTTWLCRQEGCEECRARCENLTEKVNRETSQDQREEEEEEELDEETVSELLEETDNDEGPVPVDRDKEHQDSTTAPPETSYRKMGRMFLC